MADELEKSTGVSNPLVLLQAMIDKGVDPSALEKMMDLAERWQANQSLKAFNEAMQAAQAEMPIVARNAWNDRTKRYYAALETISEVIKPILTRHGFTLSFAEEDSPKEGFARVICDVRHVGGHEKRYRGDYPYDGKGAKGGEVMSAIQGRVSTFTYAKRDMKAGIFDVTIADFDKDGNTDDQVISLEQMQQLDTLIIESKVDRPRFLAWLGERAKKEIKELEDVPAKVFKDAVDQLTRIKSQKNGGQR